MHCVAQVDSSARSRYPRRSQKGQYLSGPTPDKKLEKPQIDRRIEESVLHEEDPEKMKERREKQALAHLLVQSFLAIDAPPPL
jgi:hypothetical protein